MTTITWDGSVLAADTLMTGNAFDRHTEKLFTLGSGKYFGGCGDWQDVLAAVEWLKNESKTKPELNDSFVGILIVSGNAYRLESKLMRDPIKEKHHSVGSGASHAIVAMYLGQGAVEAIHTTAVFDKNTSFEVTYINVKGIAAP